MGEDLIYWIKVISFLLAMFMSFQIGRHLERVRLLKFFAKQGNRIEKVLDDFFSPPPGDLGARGLRPWETQYELEPPGEKTEKKYFLS
jgi:hypothetical protein